MIKIISGEIELLTISPEKQNELSHIFQNAVATHVAEKRTGEWIAGFTNGCRRSLRLHELNFLTKYWLLFDNM